MTRDWQKEHELDPPDFADSYALLDDGQIIGTVERVDTGSADWDYIRSRIKARRVESARLLEGDR